MMQPLAFVCSENLILGNQLVTRLQDLGYRVEIVSAGQLSAQARTSKPFIILCDLVSKGVDLLPTIKELRASNLTAHIPIIGITNNPNPKLQAAAVAGGATVVAMESGILAQLPQLLEMALAVE
jgi:CheY-like chemotaxis protein